MPKKRQIPRLFEQRLADGTTVFHWKPSKTLRDSGSFTNRKLGTDEALAVAEAMALNRQVAEWKSGTTISAPAMPRIVRFAELVTRYRDSKAFADLAPSTQREYSSRLEFLSGWAMDGTLPVRDIDRDLVLDLRNGVYENDSAYTAAAKLRVLRLLLSWAIKANMIRGIDGRIIKENPAASIDIKQPRPRKKRIVHDDLPWLLASAEKLGYHHTAIGCVLGFYTTQREGDLLATTRFAMRPIRDLTAEARGALAGPDGRVLGISLEQGKTHTQISIPLVPVARAALERQMAGRLPDASRAVVRTYLISKGEGGGACHEKTFQRDFRRVADYALRRVVRAVWAARAEHDSDLAWTLIDCAKRLRGVQFRDLRRSGMCWMRDLGVPDTLIAAISGHSIDQTRKILATYLPRDTRAAAEGMAMAVMRQAERDAEPGKEQSA
ncbi:hypothetical protein [Stakelama pacifica]|uniref:Core-binding (CB) domain-containing protein n=1 Tax=Stakelama pacifica TaxID=517720 RepID=A0A4R6FPJ6_9SPHN|nr:hypothetical protein [Stakelama pacifica]TDN83020.1 hypothetical protein EV664_105218 [Stakelama pacifica]GGO94912.1 hypothetical protein GCM10011329_17860 [Stakelama pacifica]